MKGRMDSSCVGLMIDDGKLPRAATDPAEQPTALTQGCVREFSDASAAGAALCLNPANRKRTIEHRFDSRGKAYSVCSIRPRSIRSSGSIHQSKSAAPADM